MTDQPAAPVVAEIEAEILSGSMTKFNAIFNRLRDRGIEQFIRPNGWGNLEWQSRRILKRMAAAKQITLNLGLLEFRRILQ